MINPFLIGLALERGADTSHLDYKWLVGYLKCVSRPCPVPPGDLTVTRSLFVNLSILVPARTPASEVVENAYPGRQGLATGDTSLVRENVSCMAGGIIRT